MFLRTDALKNGPQTSIPSTRAMLSVWCEYHEKTNKYNFNMPSMAKAKNQKFLNVD